MLPLSATEEHSTGMLLLTDVDSTFLRLKRFPVPCGHEGDVQHGPGVAQTWREAKVRAHDESGWQKSTMEKHFYSQ